MWGLNWGQMIWGQVAAVPAVGFWGVMLLAAVLGALGVTRMRGARPRIVGIVALAIAILLPISARALPFTFTNGTVADANQVNANFAALSQQALAPSASANLVDLAQNSVCPTAAGGFALDLFVGTDGIRNAFSIPVGQTLVLNNLNIVFSLGTAAAGHGLGFRVARSGAAGFGELDGGAITLDARGSGSATLSFGSGSAFRAGTKVCVLAQDLVTGSTVAPISTIAHGFLTTQ